MDHSTDARNTAADAVVDLLDVGSGDNGTLRIYDDATLLAELDLSNPAFGDAADGVAEANSISDATASDDGTADTCEFRDADGNVIFDGNVGIPRDVTAASTAANTVTIDGDITADLEHCQTITIEGSTDNDGIYTVIDFEESSGDTVITLKEALTSDTADGQVKAYTVTLNNLSITSGQTVSITSAEYEALRQ